MITGRHKIVTTPLLRIKIVTNKLILTIKHGATVIWLSESIERRVIKPNIKIDIFEIT